MSSRHSFTYTSESEVSDYIYCIARAPAKYHGWPRNNPRQSTKTDGSHR